MTAREAKSLRIAPLATPTDLQPNAVRDIAGALNILLADMFGLYLKTKNFHWHVSGPHFRDYHLLLDEHGDQIFATTDPIAERIRKLGGTTMRSIGQITRLQRIKDNDADFVTPMDMLAELREDNKDLTTRMRETHDLCDEHGDVATAAFWKIGLTRQNAVRGFCLRRHAQPEANNRLRVSGGSIAQSKVTLMGTYCPPSDFIPAWRPM
jgi:starvation-inducible DNA-binding protein